jgi:Glycosyltransferase family 43
MVPALWKSFLGELGCEAVFVLDRRDDLDSVPTHLQQCLQSGARYEEPDAVSEAVVVLPSASHHKLLASLKSLLQRFASAGGAQASTRLSLFLSVRSKLDPALLLGPESSSGVYTIRVGILPHSLSASGHLTQYLLVKASQAAEPAVSVAPAAVSVQQPYRWELTDKREHTFASDVDQPILVITPTYARSVQRACLIRVAAQLRSVPGVTWMVVEDHTRERSSTRRFLESTGIPFVYLYQGSNNSPHRGVLQRNRALDEIEARGLRGVVMFLDDDNTVDARYFPWMRKTRTIQLCSVGLIGSKAYKHCADLVHANQRGEAQSFWSSFAIKRPYPVDMLGISIHTDVLQVSRARFSLQSGRGQLETDFLRRAIARTRMRNRDIGACPAHDGVLLFHTKVQTHVCNFPHNWVIDHEHVPFRKIYQVANDHWRDNATVPTAYFKESKESGSHSQRVD